MNKNQPIFFIGIKGTGMSALACLLHDMGYKVCGSDLTKHFFTEEPLIKRNIQMYEFDTHTIEDNSLVIIGNAFLDDFSEVKKAHENTTLTCMRYHEFLGHFMENYHSFSIAGSHGKTTTTGMLETMFNSVEPCGYIVGDGSGFMPENATRFVLESCEFRRHFLKYHPDVAIVTNIDLDHVDYFKDIDDYRLAYEQFSNNCKQIVAYGDDPQVLKAKFNCPVTYYGFNDNNDAIIHIVHEDSYASQFDIDYKGNTYHLYLPIVGHHLILNATACVVVGLLDGLSIEQIEAGLTRFKGEKRRFVVEYVKDNIIIDDYAHHPTEVSVTIDAAKKRFPEKKIVAIFKPHRASRIIYFKQEFINALSKADNVYVCDFTSIDDHDDDLGIDISYLSNDIAGAKIITEDNDGAKLLASHSPCVYLFMSSKDIYHLEDLLKQIL